jgi:hypothetical protein
MPRYFFNSRGPAISDGLSDRNGQELPDVTCAKAVAREAAQQLLRADPLTDWKDWHFDIVNEDGQTVFIQPFVERASSRSPTGKRRGRLLRRLAHAFGHAKTLTAWPSRPESPRLAFQPSMAAP